MKIGIMQPYFFPYIGYWQLINAVDTFVIYDDVNFIKGGWINRNRILMNGQGKRINLKMEGMSSNKLINEIGTSDDIVYKGKLLKAIRHCYSKAPYYFKAYPIIEKIITLKETNLARYLQHSIRNICRYLSIDTKLIISSAIDKDNNKKGQDKVIMICKALGATEYYNAVGGPRLYSHKDFESEGLALRFLKAGAIKYKQFNDEFVENLSIIDLMMFNSEKDIRNMLDIYELL